MKNTKTCLKCNSRDILLIPGKHTGYGSGNIIMVGSTSIGSVKVTRYLCCNCGYSEEWIDNKMDIEKLRDKF